MAGVIKKTTGLTGLAVSKNPHYTLSVLYDKILRVLDKMPQDAAYRKYTHQIVSERLGAVQQEKEVTKLEQRLGGRQAEEYIVQAENELTLARRMLQWKPWEPLVTKPEPNQWKWPL